jgi:hypothetical protein
LPTVGKAVVDWIDARAGAAVGDCLPGEASEVERAALAVLVLAGTERAGCVTGCAARDSPPESHADAACTGMRIRKYTRHEARVDCSWSCRQQSQSCGGTSHASAVTTLSLRAAHIAGGGAPGSSVPDERAVGILAERHDDVTDADVRARPRSLDEREMSAWPPM